MPKFFIETKIRILDESYNELDGILDLITQIPKDFKASWVTKQFGDDIGYHMEREFIPAMEKII